MRTLYLFITDTLADWVPGHVLAELRSGRYLKDPALKYNVLICGRTFEPIIIMGRIRMTPEVLVGTIRPVPGDILVLPGADTWLDPAQDPVIAKVREFLDHGMVVAAICRATFGLANAGLLDNRPHTSNDLTALKMFCPHYQDGRQY